MDKKLIAARDASNKSLNRVPEWIPEDFKKQFKSDEQIIKDPRMVEFRTNVIIDDKFVKPYERLMLDEIYKTMNTISSFAAEVCCTYSSYYHRLSSIREENVKKISSLRNSITYFLSLNFNQMLEILRSNKITVGKQKLKLSTFYNKITSNFKDISEQVYKIVPHWREFYIVSDFDGLKCKKDWDLRLTKTDAKYFVVFTTKCEDILGMSARSEWTSCQDIRPSKVNSKEFNPGWAKRVVGSAKSKNVGIVYLTDGSDYDGRGERMLYRCTVHLYKDITNNQDILWIHRMYHQEDELIRNIFINEMTKQETLPILSFNKYSNIKIRIYRETQPLGWEAYDDSGFYVI